MMRIIAGTAKGTILQAPAGHNTRPTLARTRESIFNVLANVGLIDATVLDIFSGTGAMGLEALSRGADHAVLVDRATSRFIRKNAAKCHFSDRVDIISKNMESALFSLRGKKFDYIFMDPPYDKGLVNKTLEQVFQNALPASEAVIIVEHTVNEPLDYLKFCKYCSTWKEKKAGETVITYLTCHMSEDESL